MDGRSTLGKVFQVLQTTLVYTILFITFPLLVFIVLCLLLYKSIVQGIVKKFKPKLIELLNNRDAFYATDRFWKNSRSSFGLIFVLDGRISLEQIRQDFFQKVVHAKVKNNSEDDPSDSLRFPRLTQIPESYGGYYFWRKANYFLIHEHIRPIETPMDEAGLKKFSATQLHRPFPNKRPLWEILVVTSYQTGNGNSKSKESEANENNCSALLIRMHQAIADVDFVVEMMSVLCTKNNHLVKSLDPHIQNPELPAVLEIEQSQRNVINANGKMGENLAQDVIANDEMHTHNPDLVIAYAYLPSLLFKIFNIGEILVQTQAQGTFLMKIPRLFYSFLASITRHSSTLQAVENTENTALSWNNLDASCVSKMKDENNGNAATIMSVITQAFLHGVYLAQPSTCAKQMDRRCRLPILYRSGNYHEGRENFIFINNEITKGDTVDLCENIRMQLRLSETTRKSREMSRRFLKLLSIFPHPFVRYFSNLLKGTAIIYQESGNDLTKNSNDLICIGESHQILDVIPLCGLHFKGTVIAGTAIQFGNALKVSLTIKTGLFTESKAQFKVDEIVSQFPIELDNILHAKKANFYTVETSIEI